MPETAPAAPAAQVASEGPAPLPLVEPSAPGLSSETGQIPAPKTEPFGFIDQLQADRTANGVTVGDFVIRPAVAVGGAYDSNVFATAKGERSDVFAAEMPSLTVQSMFPRHAFGFKAQGEFRQYANQTTENINNASAAVDGRVDLAPNAYVLAGGSYQLSHEDRGALVAANGVKPTQYTVVSGNAAFVIEPAPLGLRLDASVDSYAYNNSVNAAGQKINEATRDRIVYALAPRISYPIAPQYDAFVRAVVNRRQYNAAPEADGIDRNSVGYGADAGIAFNVPGLEVGEVYVGYLQQSYDSRTVASLHTVDFGVNLLWRPGRATSMRLNAGRSLEESALPGAAGFIQTNVRLTIESQLANRMNLTASGAYTKADFPAFSSSTDVYELGLGLGYIIAPELSASVEYVLRHRSTMTSLPGYTRQIVGVWLRGRL
jgi:hypothetical protein